MAVALWPRCAIIITVTGPGNLKQVLGSVLEEDLSAARRRLRRRHGSGRVLKRVDCAAVGLHLRGPGRGKLMRGGCGGKLARWQQLIDARLSRCRYAW